MVYPHGLDHFATPSSSAPSSRAPSIRSQASSTQASTPKPARSGFFSRFGSSLSVPTADTTTVVSTPDGTLEELIMSGTAFGEIQTRASKPLILVLTLQLPRIRVSIDSES